MCVRASFAGFKELSNSLVARNPGTRNNGQPRVPRVPYLAACASVRRVMAQSRPPPRASPPPPSPSSPGSDCSAWEKPERWDESACVWGPALGGVALILLFFLMRLRRLCGCSHSYRVNTNSRYCCFNECEGTCWFGVIPTRDAQGNRFTPGGGSANDGSVVRGKPLGSVTV